MLRWLVILLLVSSGYCYADLKFSSLCCPKNTYLDSPYCQGDEISNERASLNCSSGMYMLDPNEFEEDEFTEAPEGELQIKAQKTLIKAGSWCVGQPVAPDDNIDPDSQKPVALTCFDIDLSKETASVVPYIYGTCMLISFGFMVLTLAVYAVLPELRDLQGKCLMGNVASLALAYLPLAFLQFYGDSVSDTVCVTKAFFLYFWILSAFFWLNVVSFNVWRTVRTQGQGQRYMREQRLFVIFCIYAWGVPFLFLISALIAHFAPDHPYVIKPNIGKSKCWFDGPTETWVYFYGPVATLITINIFFFATTAYRLWRDDNDPSLPRLRSHRFKCLLYLKLFIVMGITWIFELMSYIAAEMTWFWYMTDILNCLQGVLIFLIMVCRKRTLRAIASRKWGAALCPKSHTVLVGGVDEEESEQMSAEEVELARPANGNTVRG